ncbi:MAG: DNA recombination protein RmuC [Synechococcales cyanobacterium CRU_2_2]|nr:DNA recombination protein RmuC [Synechococcales cyanobacterium CRU_2_2]
MGKLTDSFKDTSQQLGKLKQGIQQMQALGEALADNTQDVAAAALRTGYAYAKVEAAQAEVASAQTSKLWTLPMLKAEFATAAKAYGHLKAEFGVSLRSRSWQNILDAWNEALEQKPSAQLCAPERSPQHLSPEPSALEQRLLALERLVAQQSVKIAQLEAQTQARCHR